MADRHLDSLPLVSDQPVLGHDQHAERQRQRRVGKVALVGGGLIVLAVLSALVVSYTRGGASHPAAPQASQPASPEALAQQAVPSTAAPAQLQGRAQSEASSPAAAPEDTAGEGSRIVLKSLEGLAAPAPAPADWELDTAAAPAPEPSPAEELVVVELYAESLCPDTTRAVRNVLHPLFENGIASLFRFRYFAYGKAEVAEDGSFECQHGPEECKANRYINCAQELHPQDQAEWFAYVHCVQGTYWEEIVPAAAGSCADERGWDKDELVQCAEGELGDELDRQAREATESLDPSLTYVPWLLLNGSEEVTYDLPSLGQRVCAAYMGDARPAACDELDR